MPVSTVASRTPLRSMAVASLAAVMVTSQDEQQGLVRVGRVCADVFVNPSVITPSEETPVATPSVDSMVPTSANMAPVFQATSPAFQTASPVFQASSREDCAACNQEVTSQCVLTPGSLPTAQPAAQPIAAQPIAAQPTAQTPGAQPEGRWVYVPANAAQQPMPTQQTGYTVLPQTVPGQQPFEELLKYVPGQAPASIFHGIVPSSYNGPFARVFAMDKSSDLAEDKMPSTMDELLNGKFNGAFMNRVQTMLRNEEIRDRLMERYVKETAEDIHNICSAARLMSPGALMDWLVGRPLSERSAQEGAALKESFLTSVLKSNLPGVTTTTTTTTTSKTVPTPATDDVDDDLDLDDEDFSSVEDFGGEEFTVLEQF
ncbi:hypothetical protein GNI_049830 [Gregarina niphandrodes]|uniref:Uncharacterized protein n=1 Tax=Gregarina niphandrodes TaxID=110365 RepID=A0A023B9N6_GRENI|nr:hypothetical protein GNI_049830 [Gregarina niphandrodes]EZG73006.1 hypothetical protein GNI_049830 [Gregarina niphandrodes]|eukprot:XP_011129701.1 hypothetical protein GNI_049830 [Gregarina niphandrodes]